MRDEDDGAGVGPEVLLEPDDGLEVEVVRGLVEQEHVRLLEEELRERDPHLPPAAELLGHPGVVFHGEPEPGQDLGHLRIHREPVPGLELVVQVGVLAHDPVVLGVLGRDLGHVVLELAHPGLDHGQTPEDRHGLVEQRAALERELLLGQVPVGRVPRRGDAPLARMDVTADEPQERRLPRAVWPDETDAVVVADPPVHVAEERLPRERHSDVLDLDHGTPPNRRRPRGPPPARGPRCQYTTCLGAAPPARNRNSLEGVQRSRYTRREASRTHTGNAGGTSCPHT